MITQDEAVAIATDYIKDRVQLSEGSHVVVTEDEDTFTVEWKTVPVSRGPDFDARVRVDKRGGAVLDMMVGS